MIEFMVGCLVLVAVWIIVSMILLTNILDIAIAVIIAGALGTSILYFVFHIGKFTMEYLK